MLENPKDLNTIKLILKTFFVVNNFFIVKILSILQWTISKKPNMFNKVGSSETMRKALYILIFILI